MNNCLCIAITETKGAAVSNGGSIVERFNAAAKVAKNHWLVTNEDERFRAAVGGVMASYKEDSPEFDRIKKEMAGLNQLSAMLIAAQAGLTVNLPEQEEGFEPIGLLKIWKEIK